MAMDVTVITDPSDRDKHRKELFLYVMGLRDILVVKSFFEEIKDTNLKEIVKNDIVGKTYAFITCYGKIFHHNDKLGKINFDQIKTGLSSDEIIAHDNLMRMRYAHNDPEHNNLMIYYDAKQSKITAIASLRYSYLGDSKEIILCLLNKIKNIFENKRDDLLSKLYSRENGYQVNDKQSFSISYYSGFIENSITR